jgi:hypothetical protein
MPRRVRGPRARDITLTREADEALAALERSNRPAEESVARRVRALGSALQANALDGEPVKHAVLRRKSAARLVRRHGLENCFCIDLPDGWRLLYTVIRQEQRVHVVVVEIVDHATYDSWFPGRGR